MEPTISEFTIMFSIATVGMLVLALAIVFFVIFYQKRMLENRLKQQKLESEYQQKMMLASLESQENERRRVAGDLHDSIGAMLSTIRVSLSTMMRQEAVNTQSIGQAKQMLDDTIDSVRRISRDLMPATLEKFGLSYALKEMCEQYTMVSGIEIQFSEQGNPIALAKNSEIMIFRISQEFINNSIKHSNAKTIATDLQWESELNVSISDDGAGFDVDKIKSSGKGLGLFNMENRAAMLGANLSFTSNIGKGTKALMRVPLPK
jgi:two-component system, NarL family, sensor kinase